MDERAVSGERVTSYDHATKQYPKGRTCREPHCRTRLSIYNDGDFCSLHEPVEAPRLRGKKIA
jgi:hypothetical protein